MNVSNLTFLKAIFGEDYIWSHTASFSDDPSNIPNDRRAICWSGDYFSRCTLQPNTNQYFCISTFMADDTGKARRRKALFRCTHVIVADDVVEKLPIENVQKLPPPTYRLQTSIGSEQWGWCLNVPCQDQHRVDNLLDGLVQQGLAPQGKDPGMRSTTRFVRLPEGVNTKKSKLVNGKPVKCEMIEWNPTIRVSMEALAAPFKIDLDAERRESKVDGASNVPDHPLLQIPEIIHVKEVLSGGRYDVSCPWRGDHTGQSDDGSAIFTNDDGSIGFRCHHGSCQHRTGADLLYFIEQSKPGFKADFDKWRVMRSFASVVNPPSAELNFMGSQNPSATSQNPSATSQNPSATSQNPSSTNSDQMISYQDIVDKLKCIPSTSSEATALAYDMLKAVDALDHGSRLTWWGQVRDHMDWTKSDLQSVLEQQRKEWYPKTVSDVDFYESCVYVAEQNQFYDTNKRMWYTPEAYQNSFSHFDKDARTEALIEGRVRKVDRIDYAPGMPEIFTEGGSSYINGWVGDIEQGVPGDVQRWLSHFDTLGWSKNKDHMLKWMAFTLRHPERKINHMLLLAGGEGTGKDFLLYPLMRAMGNDGETIYGGELLRDFNDYILSTKYLHINETELGDHRDAKSITNKLKSLAAAPPAFLRSNIKGKTPVKIRNIINVSMTSNSFTPINLTGDSRRVYGVWTDLKIRNEDGQMTEEWDVYWEDRWQWLRDQEGWKACVHYLMTAVDLSNFDPGKTPGVTEFVRCIQEVSEDPLGALIKEFVERKLSFLKSDIVTSADIRQALKTAGIANTAVELKSVPSAQIIGKVMRQNGIGIASRMWGDKKESRVWIIRNHASYVEMPGKKIYQEYQKQMSELRSETLMSVVK